MKDESGIDFEITNFECMTEDEAEVVLRGIVSKKNDCIAKMEFQPAAELRDAEREVRNYLAEEFDSYPDFDTSSQNRDNEITEERYIENLLHDLAEEFPDPLRFGLTRSRKSNLKKVVLEDVENDRTLLETDYLDSYSSAFFDLVRFAFLDWIDDNWKTRREQLEMAREEAANDESETEEAVEFVDDLLDSDSIGEALNAIQGTSLEDFTDETRFFSACDDLLGSGFFVEVASRAIADDVDLSSYAEETIEQGGDQ